MALAIRMRQQGRHGLQTYRIVLMDEKSRRDGKYVEQLGWYNPHETEQEKQILINAGRVLELLNVGAKLSDNVENLLNQTAPEVMKERTRKAVEARNKARLKAKARVKAKAKAK